MLFVKRFPSGAVDGVYLREFTVSEHEAWSSLPDDERWKVMLQATLVSDEGVPVFASVAEMLAGVGHVTLGELLQELVEVNKLNQKKATSATTAS